MQEELNSIKSKGSNTDKNRQELLARQRNVCETLLKSQKKGKVWRKHKKEEDEAQLDLAKVCY